MTTEVQMFPMREEPENTFVVCRSHEATHWNVLAKHSNGVEVCDRLYKSAEIATNVAEEIAKQFDTVVEYVNQ